MSSSSIYIGPYQVLLLQAKVDLGVMAMKRYSTFPKAPALLKAHYQMLFNVISRTLVRGRVLLLSKDAIDLVWFSLFNGISTFVGYLMPNSSF